MRPVSIAHPDHHVNVARRKAEHEGRTARGRTTPCAPSPLCSVNPSASTHSLSGGSGAGNGSNETHKVGDIAQTGQQPDSQGVALAAGLSDLAAQEERDLSAQQAQAAAVVVPGERGQGAAQRVAQRSAQSGGTAAGGKCSAVQLRPFESEGRTAAVEGMERTTETDEIATATTGGERDGGRALFADQFENLANFR